MDTKRSSASNGAGAQATPGQRLGRALTMAFGLFAYASFLLSFTALVFFVTSYRGFSGLDHGTVEPVGRAVAINVALLSLFAFQHTVMARQSFKRWWTRVVPEPIERSTYVLATSLALFAIIGSWRPIAGDLFRLEGAARIAVLGLASVGWLTVLVSTFLIDHFDLFGLRQTWYHATGRPYPGLQFKEVSLYRWVRHPLMLGLVIGIWATPHMTWSHLLFAGGMTLYILCGIPVEERSLVEIHGDDYLDYRRRIPRLLPFFPPRRDT